MRLARWILLCVLAGVRAVHADNLLAAESFDDSGMQWESAGEAVTAAPDADVRHSSGQALHVADRGAQMGQATCPMIPVKDGDDYFVKLWVRVDPDLADTVVVDIQSFLADGSVRGGSIRVAELDGEQTGWVRAAKIFRPRVGATQVRIRVMPAASAGPSHGACWIDDVVFKRAADMTADDLDLRHMKVAEDLDEAVRVQFADAGGPTAGGFDFEDLTGWTVRYPAGMDSIRLARSRWQLCQGNYVARLAYQTFHAGQTVELVPPEPIVVTESFDTITLWIGQFFDNFTLANVLWEEGPTPRVNLVDATGARHRVSLSRVVWQNWSVARGKLPEPLPAPVRVEALGLDNLPACRMLMGPRSYPGTEQRNYAFDALRFTSESSSKIELALPQAAIPTRPETLLPSLSAKEFNTRPGRQGQDFTLTYHGADETVRYVYTPASGRLDDLRVTLDEGRSFQPMAQAGPVFEGAPDEKAIKRSLISCELAGDVLTASWALKFTGETTVLTYRMELRQKTLFLTVTSDDSQVSKFLWGTIGGAPAESLYVPFLTWTGWQQQHTVYLVDGAAFVSRLPDFYVSDFSTITYDGTQGVNVYQRLTDGTRHKLNERWLVTISSRFEEVLPNIPHPPNRAAKEFGSYVFARDLLQSYRTQEGREACLAYLRLCKRYGLDHMMIKMTHLTADQADWGLLPAMNVYDQAPRSMEGGMRALRQHFRDVQKLGFKALLYTDYHELDPTSEYWNPDFAVQTSDGNWMDSWRHCYKMTPLAGPAIVRNMTRRVKDTLNIDGTYLDESGSSPWSATDYDARKPGAGLGRIAHQAQMEMAGAESPIHGGPSYGEGGMQWLWAGFLSGTYGQSYWPGWNDKHVWLVDFEVRKVHTLMTNLSMGYDLSRYGGLPCDDLEWANDRFHAAAIAFGHAGCFKAPLNLEEGDRIEGQRWIWRAKGRIFNEYFTFQALQEAYALVPVAAVHYERGGKEYNTSDALRQRILNDNHVHVSYENGLEVYVNGSVDKDDVWEVKRGSVMYRLPQNGYMFEQPGKLSGYGALINGRRVDFVDGPRYLWADARGKMTDFGPLQTAGCVVIRKDAPGGDDVILVSGDAVTLDLPALKRDGIAAENVVALDEQERPLGQGRIGQQGSRLTLEATRSIISYRLAAAGRD